MVKRDVVASKVTRATAWLNDASVSLLGSLDDYESDEKGRDLALFYLFLAVQECIDIAAHWVADDRWGEPDNAGAAFTILAERGVIDRPTAAALRAATGLRNRIAHGYAMLDYARVHREAQTGVPALQRFLLATSEAIGA